MTEALATKVSPLRLRVGIILLFLWWIPFWMAIPAISDLFDITSSKGIQYLTAGVLIVQTIVGVIGFIIAGKQVAMLVRKTKYKQMPGRVWHIVWTGKVD